MENSRTALYDNIKFFLISCVVFGHIGNQFADLSHNVACIRFWIYLFHIPAFVFISGLFSKRTVRERKWIKVVPYILLYIVMEMLAYGRSIVKVGVQDSSLDFFHENGVAWFALAMFWWYAITILVQKIHPAYVLAVIVFISLISGYCERIDSFLVMQRTIVFYPFFYVGYIIDPIKLKDRLRKKPIRIAGILPLAISIAVSFLCFGEIHHWRKLFRGIFAYSQIKEGLPYGWGFAWRASGYLISAILIMCIIAVMPEIQCFVTRIGRRTLPVYVFHNYLLLLLLAIIPAFNQWMSSEHIMIKCVLYTAVIVLITSLKPFDWVTRLIMNPPERKNNQ